MTLMERNEVEMQGGDQHESTIAAQKPSLHPQGS